MRRKSDELLFINLAIERIDRALRQEKRMQRAYRAHRKQSDRLRGRKPAPAPKPWTRSRQRLDDEVYFAIVAVRQAIAARRVLVHLGHDVPEIRNEAALVAWRDVLEHWDDPPAGKRLRASAQWRKLSEDVEPGLSFAGYGDEVTLMSDVSVEDLREDVKALRKAAVDLSRQAFDETWLTAERAATLLGVDSDDIPRGIFHMEFPKLGVRYSRDWVDARVAGEQVPMNWQQWMR